MTSKQEDSKINSGCLANYNTIDQCVFYHQIINLKEKEENIELHWLILQLHLCILRI
jgi:hypothetical protein